jgi:hypothetical protein
MLLLQIGLLLCTTFLTFLLYPFWIKFLYKFKMGERIRVQGPETHLKKQGTPTMGGLVFVVSVSFMTFFFNKSREQSILPLFIATLSGAFGLLEDFSKLYKQNVLANILPFFNNPTNQGPLRRIIGIFGSKTGKGDLDSLQKLLIQLAIGGFVAYWTYFKLGWHTLWVPLFGFFISAKLCCLYRWIRRFTGRIIFNCIYCLVGDCLLFRLLLVSGFLCHFYRCLNGFFIF